MAGFVGGGGGLPPFNFGLGMSNIFQPRWPLFFTKAVVTYPENGPTPIEQRRITAHVPQAPVSSAKAAGLFAGIVAVRTLETIEE